MTAPAFVPVTTGSRVSASGRTYRVTHLLGLGDVLAEDVETGIPERLRIDALGPVPAERVAELSAPGVETGAKAAGAPNLGAIGEAEWEMAQRRLAAIKPLLEDPFRTREMVEAAAATQGVSAATVYRWMRSYLDSGPLSALIPRPDGRKPGTKRVRTEVEAVIASAIEDKYLKRQKRKPSEVVEAVLERCRTAGIEAPHQNTVRKRIRDLPVATVLRRLGQRDVARTRYEPIRGSFPGADVPLAVVQIDHTEADIGTAARLGVQAPEGYVRVCSLAGSDAWLGS